MPPNDLRFPLLNFTTSENKQHIVSDDSITQIVSSKDAEFNSISISGLDSDRTTLLNRTQKISSDGSSTFITGDLVCDADIKVSGNVFNVDAEVSVSDHVLIASDGGSVPAFKVTNVNNTSPPLVVQHAGSDIFSLAIDGSITNATTTSLQSQITQEISDRQAAITSVNSSITTEQSERLSSDTLLSNRVTVLENDSTDADAITQLQTDLATEISDRQTDVSDEETARINADNALDARLTTEEGNVDTLQSEMTAVESKTQHQTADASSTKFAVDSKVKWDTGDQYFCIKSRDTLSVSDSSSEDKVLDFKSHQYAINGANTGVYEICLMSSDASSSTAFFNAKLVRYTDSAVMYPLASYKVSASYTHASDTISFTFDESTTQDFIISWQLVN
jgi:hypothetical protein